MKFFQYGEEFFRLDGKIGSLLQEIDELLLEVIAFDTMRSERDDARIHSLDVGFVCSNSGEDFDDWNPPARRNSLRTWIE
jgi:hypothetical protein